MLAVANMISAAAVGNMLAVANITFSAATLYCTIIIVIWTTMMVGTTCIISCAQRSVQHVHHSAGCATIVDHSKEIVSPAKSFGS